MYSEPDKIAQSGGMTAAFHDITDREVWLREDKTEAYITEDDQVIPCGLL